MVPMPRPLLAGVVGCFVLSAALDRALAVDPALAGATQLRGEINAKLYGGKTP